MNLFLGGILVLISFLWGAFIVSFEDNILSKKWYYYMGLGLMKAIMLFVPYSVFFMNNWSILITSYVFNILGTFLIWKEGWLHEINSDNTRTRS